MQHWFKAKDYGWGWTPASWQGWALTLLWLVANITYAFQLGDEPTQESLLSFITFVGVSTLLFILLAWKTGDRPSWRWRGEPVRASVVWRKTAQLIIFVLIAQAAGLIGTFFTMDAIPAWYASLAKPWFSPPNWIFGPVWTTLYTLMGIAAFFVWEERFHKTHASRGMNWYWTQLALNALWSPVFFGAKQMGAAFVIIILIWCAVLLTIREFWRVNPWLGAFLLPYLAWISFAGILNYQLWMLN